MQLNGFNIESGDYGIWIDENYKPLHVRTAPRIHGSRPMQKCRPLHVLSSPNKPSPSARHLLPLRLMTEWPDNSTSGRRPLGAGVHLVHPHFRRAITRSLSVAWISANYENAELREGHLGAGDYFSFKGDGMSLEETPASSGSHPAQSIDSAITPRSAAILPVTPAGPMARRLPPPSGQRGNRRR